MKFLVRRRAIQPIPLAPGDLAALALQRLDYCERLSKSGHVLLHCAVRRAPCPGGNL